MRGIFQLYQTMTLTVDLLYKMKREQYSISAYGCIFVAHTHLVILRIYDLIKQFNSVNMV